VKKLTQSFFEEQYCPEVANATIQTV